MDVNDENKPDQCSKLQVIHRISSQSPLKPVNDDRRLSTTQGMNSSSAKKTPITSPYKYIRELDSAERWIERTSVVTKQDHMQNLENARLILLDIIGDLPVENLPNERMTSDEVSSKKEKDAVCQMNRKEPKILQEVDELADLLCGLDIAHGLSFTNSPSKAVDDNSALQFNNNACIDQVHSVSSESNTVLKMQLNDSAENTAKQGIEMIENLIFDPSNTQTLYSPTNKHMLVSELTNVEFMKRPSIWVGKDESVLLNKKKLGTLQTDFKPLNSPTAEKLIPLSAVNDESVVETVVDPLENKFQLPDSPTVEKPTRTILDNELVVETVADPTDPFQTKFQLPNSPAVEKRNATPTKQDDKFTLDTATVSSDPFKTKFQLPNSPSVDKPVSQPTVADELAVEAVEKSTDPFKTKFQLPNSLSVDKPVSQPTVADELAVEKSNDPFKTKFQIPNSPCVEKEIQLTVDEFVVEKATDPFKTQFQLPNSPSVEKEIQPTVDEFVVEKATDPFKTKFQLPNSPFVEKEIQPTVDEFVVEKATDPFKIKFQLPNSPADDKPISQPRVDDESEKPTNPFKSKAQLPNSPRLDSLEPFASNDKLQTENLVIAHTFSGLYETDQNKYLQDSTFGYNILTEMNLNPAVVSDAPHIKENSSSGGLLGQPCLNISKNKSLDFTNGVLESDLNTCKDLSIKNVSKEESQFEAHEQAAVEKTPVEENSLTTEKEVLNFEDNADLENDENFIPATEAFNNPEFFDMLEKSSNIKGPNSKRGSVLLKFDPLQERRESLLSKPLCSSPGPIQKQPRVSDVFKDSKALGLSFVDDSVCLFGTPPRVARRRTLTRRVYNNRVQSIEEESAANEVDMIFGIDEDCDGMDTIVHENLIPGSKGAVLVDVGEPCTYTESEVKRIRADLTMHFQELILKKDKEFQEKLKVQEDEANKEKAQLKADSDGLKNKVKNLQGKLRSLNEVMKEYTDIISQVTAEKKKVTAEQEKLTIELAELQKYNSQVLDDNKTLEKSFDDLFHRYEKLKQTLEKAAENEKILKQAVESAQEKFKSSKETAKKIKEMAETKIAEQEDKYEKLTTSTKSEITRLEAALKMKEMQIQGLESTLEQKRKENKELTDLCDSLINKVS